MPRILCVGKAALDHIFTLEQLPEGDAKYPARAYQVVGGGIAANAAVAIQRLGGQAALCAPLGDDITGDAIRAGLESEGVDTEALQQLPGFASPVSAVMVDATGQRCLVSHQDPALFAKAQAPQGIEAQAEALLADTRWPNGALPLMAQMQARGKPVLLDFDQNAPADPAAFLSRSSHIIFARAGLAEISGTSDPRAGLEQIAAKYPARLAVTLGAEGLLWLDRRQQMQQRDAFCVTAVDTTAAGDTFHGAALLALVEGAEFSEALAFAAAAAALKVSRSGGRSGIPHRNEVKQLLRSHA